MMKLYYIEWIDSTTHSGWRNIDSIGNEELTCKSIGWIVNENDESITLSSSVDSLIDEKIQHCVDAMTIPRIAIVLMQEIIFR